MSAITDGWRVVREWARRLKRELRVLAILAVDPRLPRAPRLLAALVVGYALSPIDLIPDWIPILGYLDDLILLPLGIWLVLRLVPQELQEDARNRADGTPLGRGGRIAAAVILLTWAAVALAAGWWAWQRLTINV